MSAKLASSTKSRLNKFNYLEIPNTANLGRNCRFQQPSGLFQHNPPAADIGLGPRTGHWAGAREAARRPPAKRRLYISKRAENLAAGFHSAERKCLKEIRNADARLPRAGRVRPRRGALLVAIQLMAHRGYQFDQRVRAWGAGRPLPPKRRLGWDSACASPTLWMLLNFRSRPTRASPRCS